MFCPLPLSYVHLTHLVYLVVYYLLLQIDQENTMNFTECLLWLNIGFRWVMAVGLLWYDGVCDVMLYRPYVMYTLQQLHSIGSWCSYYVYKGRWWCCGCTELPHQPSDERCRWACHCSWWYPYGISHMSRLWFRRPKALHAETACCLVHNSGILSLFLYFQHPMQLSVIIQSAASTKFPALSSIVSC